MKFVKTKNAKDNDYRFTYNVLSDCHNSDEKIIYLMPGGKKYSPKMF